MTLYTPLRRDWCRQPGGRLNRQDRQDVVQEVFLKVGRAIKDFDVEREGRSLRAWLRVVTENTINDFLDKNERRKNVNRLMSDTGHIKRPRYEPVAIAEEPGERTLLLRQVLKIVKPQFGQRDWEIIDLLVNAEKTSTEVAEIMGMKGDAVRKIKSRILKRIREEYESLGIADDLPEEVQLVGILRVRLFSRVRSVCYDIGNFDVTIVQFFFVFFHRFFFRFSYLIGDKR